MDADMTALAEAEDELRIAATAFDIQQAMLSADPQGVILRVNRAFTQVYRLYTRRSYRPAAERTLFQSARGGLICRPLASPRDHGFLGR
jgi:hypothetical protein